MYKMHVVSKGKFDDRGYSNEESIAYLQLQKPEAINAFLTYNYGLDDDRFPLTFLTEGQGRNGVVEVNTVQWTWPVMGRMKFIDMLTNAPVGDRIGLGGAEFVVSFSTHWFIEQHTLIAPDGETQFRIQKDMGEGVNGYEYLIRLVSPDPNAYVPAELLTTGKYWSIGASTVEESYSKGNRSNVMGPGKMTSQLEFYRYSKEIAGNLANTITEYEFKNGAGASSRLWINEEMKQFNIQNRVKNEERLWLAQYNRTENGEVTLRSRDTGKPIPHTAGMLEICRENNYDTYGEILTLNKIKRTVGDVFDRDTDDGHMDIVLMGGKGFLEDDPETSLQTLQAYLEGIPYQDSRFDENHYTQMLYVIFSLLGLHVDSQVRTAKGRLDVVVRTEGHIYVMEVKLDRPAREAIEQIDSKNYLLPYSLDGRQLTQIGISFSTEERNVTEWVIS